MYILNFDLRNAALVEVGVAIDHLCSRNYITTTFCFQSVTCIPSHNGDRDCLKLLCDIDDEKMEGSLS